MCRNCQPQGKLVISLVNDSGVYINYTCYGNSMFFVREASSSDTSLIGLSADCLKGPMMRLCTELYKLKYMYTTVQSRE